MNYPDLIWHLIELVIQKEKDSIQEIDEVEKNEQLNPNVHDETISVD